METFGTNFEVSKEMFQLGSTNSDVAFISLSFFYSSSSIKNWILDDLIAEQWPFLELENSVVSHLVFVVVLCNLFVHVSNNHWYQCLICLTYVVNLWQLFVKTDNIFDKLIVTHLNFFSS